MEKFIKIIAGVFSVIAVMLMLVRFIVPIDGSLILAFSICALCFYTAFNIISSKREIHHIFIWLFIVLMWIYISNLDKRIKGQNKQQIELKKELEKQKQISM